MMPRQAPTRIPALHRLTPRRFFTMATSGREVRWSDAVLDVTCKVRRFAFVAVAMISWATALHAQTPPVGVPGAESRAQGCPAAIASPPPGGIALVLSGGGARGLAHIGVLRVLDSLGVAPTMVVGTSMGALVGALYAGGLSGRQIDSLARELPFETLFRRYEPISFLTAG